MDTKQTILDKARGMYASDSYIDVIKLAKSFGLEVFPNEKVTNARVYFKEPNTYAIEVNPTHSTTRQRFSIAHELSHYILHKEDIKQLKTADRDSENSLDREKEEAANTLAAEILMPETIITKYYRDNLRFVDYCGNNYKHC